MQPWVSGLCVAGRSLVLMCAGALKHTMLPHSQPWGLTGSWCLTASLESVLDPFTDDALMHSSVALADAQEHSMAMRGAQQPHNGSTTRPCSALQVSSHRRWHGGCLLHKFPASAVPKSCPRSGCGAVLLTGSYWAGLLVDMPGLHVACSPVECSKTKSLSPQSP